MKLIEFGGKNTFHLMLNDEGRITDEVMDPDEWYWDHRKCICPHCERDVEQPAWEYESDEN